MLDPARTTLIANPAAGGGNIGKNWPAISAQLHAALGDIELQLTTHVGHAAEIAGTAIKRGATTIISFGGDGTHSEVCDGILRAPAGRKVALGILHAGTGGDFRRMIEGSDDLESACAAIKRREVHTIDAGWVDYVRDDGSKDGRHFLNITSLGMSGLVDRFVAQSNRPLGGSVAYLTGTLRAQAQYKPARVRIHVDGKAVAEETISTVCVCNGRWAGGGMMFAPNAVLNDGLFDIVVIRAMSTLRGLPVMAGLYKGTHIKSPMVLTFRGREVQVEQLEHTAWMDIDGEAPGTAPCEFKILPGALQLIAVKPQFLA